MANNEDHDLVSEDLETEILNISGALVIDSEQIEPFVDEIEAVLFKYSYLEQFNFKFS